MSAVPAISFDGVKKRFGRETAVADVSLDVPAGKSTVILGPSGCGKSTLLRLALGLIAPDGGRVLVDGEPPADWPAVRRRWGYVPSDGGLFPHLTAAANVAISKADVPGGRDARLAELCELTRLDGALLRKRPDALSAGQKQRVALMRALYHDPAVLLFDEPTAALDPVVRAGLRDDLVAIVAGAAKTVVLVTHDLDEAALFAGRVVLMRAGRVVQAGSPADLVERPAEPFVTEFVAAQRSHWPEATTSPKAP